MRRGTSYKIILLSIIPIVALLLLQPFGSIVRTFLDASPSEIEEVLGQEIVGLDECHSLPDGEYYCHTHASNIFLPEYDPADLRDPNPELLPSPSTVEARLELVGHINFDTDGDGLSDPGARSVSDVWALGNFAYVGTYDKPTCSNHGVRIVDISDPSHPVQVGNIQSLPNTRINDVKVIHIETVFFKGDILVHSNEPCRTSIAPGSGGIRIYDVTDPTNPILLSQIYSFPVHNVFIYQQGDRAYVLVVDIQLENHLRILDITFPHRPNQVAGLGVKELGLLGPTLGSDPAIYLHDVWVKIFPSTSPNPHYSGKTIAYLSYWDAGLVILDITDASSPVFLGNSRYADPDPLTGRTPEGNSHASVPTADGNFVLMADEDLLPYGLVLGIEEGIHRGEEYPAVQTMSSPPISLLENASFLGPTNYVGLACDSSVLEDAQEVSFFQDILLGEKMIAIVDQGSCGFDLKIANVVSKGYEAIIFLGQSEDLLLIGGRKSADPIPSVFVRRSTGFSIQDGVKIRVGITFDGWGYLRLLDVSDPGIVSEVGQFAVENTFTDPPPVGNHTIHNIVVDGDLAFIAWYADGIRILNISNPHDLREIASFSVPAIYDPEGNLLAHTDFWGIYVHRIEGEMFILGTDRNSGLYILRLIL